MPRLIFFRLTSVNVFRFPYLLVFAFVFPFVFYLVFSLMFLFAFPLVFLFLGNTVSTLCLPMRISSLVRRWVQVVLRSALYVCSPLLLLCLPLTFNPWVPYCASPPPPTLRTLCLFALSSGFSFSPFRWWIQVVWPCPFCVGYLLFVSCLSWSVNPWVPLCVLHQNWFFFIFARFLVVCVILSLPFAFPGAFPPPLGHEF